MYLKISRNYKNNQAQQKVKEKRGKKESKKGKGFLVRGISLNITYQL